MFSIAEFGIESIIRTGLTEMKTDTDMKLDDIFGRLRLPDILIKYGDGEITKIKEVIMKVPIHVVQAQNNLMNMEIPAISIHLLADTEDDNKSGFNDFAGEVSTPIDPQVIINTFTPLSYDSSSGKISIDDSIDLDVIYAGKVFKDGLGQTYQILDPISNINGDKYITIAKDIIGISLPNSQIISSIKERIHQLDYSPANENIMIGIHSNNSLLTKYLYYIMRYLLWRKRSKFQEYQLELSKYNGSDFAIAPLYIPEGVHSRYITAQFVTYNYWKGDEKIIIDAINPNIGGAGPYAEVVCNFVLASYNNLTGIVSVSDSVDLSQVIVGHFLFDGAGNIFKILGNINNTNGSKGFRIDVGQTVDLSNGCIKQKYTVRVKAGEDDYVDRTWSSNE